MSDHIRADDVEEERSNGAVVAGLVRQHYEDLVGVGFAADEAYGLACNYHWWMLTGGETEEEE